MTWPFNEYAMPIVNIPARNYATFKLTALPENDSALRARLGCGRLRGCEGSSDGKNNRRVGSLLAASAAQARVLRNGLAH
jgi:hypothetical protein